MAESAETTELMSAVGHTGLKGANSGILYEEFLPELRDMVGMRQYREMAENDPVIGAILFLFEMLVRNLKWRMEPADETAAAKDGADFADGVLFKDMAHPFSGLIIDAISMLPYGFAPVEVIFKRRAGEQPELVLTPQNVTQRPVPPAPSSNYNDNKIGIARTFLLNQDTIWRWFFDAEDNWIALQQMTDDRAPVIVPRQKLLLFRTTSKLGNPTGRSALRSAFVPYVRKKALEISEGRLAMRSAGVVVMRLPEEYFDSSDPEMQAKFGQFKAMADKLAQDRQGFVILPSSTLTDDGTGEFKFNIEFVTADSRSAADVSGPIQRYDLRIAGTVLADVLLMGQDKVGSLALSTNKTSMFGNALKGMVGGIRDELNRTLLPRLWRANGMPPETMPQLQHGDFEQRDLDKLGLFIQSLSAAGMQLFPNPKLESALLTEAQLPEPDDALSPSLDDGPKRLIAPKPTPSQAAAPAAGTSEPAAT